MLVETAPVDRASQLLYLFNGLEPADGSCILQPVLQWGDSGPDDDGENRTGPFWAVASWLVFSPDGDAIHTPHVRVKPGDQLVGVMTLTGQTAEGFYYSCGFDGIAGTWLLPPPIPELVWCSATLEAYELQGQHTPPYDLNSRSEYPPEDRISFTSIDIATDVAGPPGLWSARDFVSQFGEKTDIVANSSTGGKVDILFQ